MLGLESLNEGTMSDDRVSKCGSSITRNLNERHCHAGCVGSMIHPDDTPLAGLSCVHRGFIIHRTTAYCHLVVHLQSPDYLPCLRRGYQEV